MKEQVKQQSDRDKQYQKSLQELQEKKANIIDAIAKTGLNDAFTNKLSELEREEHILLARIKKAKRQPIPTPSLITEDMVRNYLASFKDSLRNGDRNTIKTFLQPYVERVDVGTTKEKVTLRVAFSFSQNSTSSLCYVQETRLRLALRWA